MTSEEIFKTMQDLIAEQFAVNADDVTMTSSFEDDLSADSVDLVELVMAMEEEFEIDEIPEEDLLTLKTVGDLVHHTTPRVVPPARRMILLVIVGTLPLFVMVPFRRFFEGLSDNMYFIGGALLFTGVLLFVSDRVRRGGKTEKTARLADALVVGIGQAIALCPGVSRSGMTITTGCFVGFERKFAVRFSFILSIPAILGANILSIKDAVDAGINWSEMPMYLIGVAVAAVTGYLCIRLLKMIADRGRFGAFAYYCWTVGALVLIFTIV